MFGVGSRGIGASVAGVWAMLVASSTAAADVSVAVASNFREAAQEIAAAFDEETGHRAVLSFGSTGQLFTQITQGAPFQVLLAADEARPARLMELGLGAPTGPFTYAVGGLVLYSPDPTLVRGEETLRSGSFSKLAIANPVTAPYGTAAVEVMKALGVYAGLAAKLVKGNNVSQAYQFVMVRSAELGFVASSQIAGAPGGSRWSVPQELHTPIRQDAVMLTTGSESEAARAFVAFLQGARARAIIERRGYGLEK